MIRRVLLLSLVLIATFAINTTAQTEYEPIQVRTEPHQYILTDHDKHCSNGRRMRVGYDLLIRMILTDPGSSE